MYITCEQCSTIYRLNEKLLKPDGSKVRCSQCQRIFIARPPEPVLAEADDFGAAAALAGQPTQQQDTFDQELSGIDLAELDSILEQGRESGTGADYAEQVDGLEADELVELDEADLDMDFEAALDFEEETPQVADAVTDTVDEEVAQALHEEVDSEVEDIDLDMDFDLEVGDDITAAPAAEEGDSLADDLEMEFSLDDSESALAQTQTEEDTTGESDLTEDVELALSDFEGALDQIDEAGAESLSPGAAGEAADESAQAESDDLGLGDLDALLDEVETEPSDDHDMEDIELSLDDSDQIVEEAADLDSDAVEQKDDLDLAGLEDIFDEVDRDSEISVGEPEDEELSLDDAFAEALGEEPAAESPSTEAAALDTAADAEDDLDLAGLDDLLVDDEEPSDQAAEEDIELSLDDDLELSLDEEAPDFEKEPDAVEAGGDDIDFGSLDDLLSDEEEGTESVFADSEEDDLALSLDDGLELSLDEEPDLAVESDAGDTQAEVDRGEFDLSDFEDLLSEDKAAEEEEEDILDFGDLDDAADEVEEEIKAEADDLDLSLDDDLDLSLDLEDETQAVAAADADEDIEGLEDLDFEIDAEFEDKPIAKTGEALELEDASEPAVQDEELDLADKQDEEIDLTDIEKMLEDDTIAPEKTGATVDFELDSEDGGAEKWTDEGGDDLGLGSGDELDLTDIEAAIDAADTEPGEDSLMHEDGDLELDLDLDESTKAESADEPEELVLEMEDEPLLELESDAAGDKEESDELDLSEFDFSVDEKSALETDTIDAGDIQLEFQVEDQQTTALGGDETIEASKTTAASAAAETTDFLMDDDDFTAEETITTEPIQPAPAKPAARAPKKKKKKGSGKLLIVILILALLGGGGYYGYDYMVKNNLYIPYLSDYINPEAKDPQGIINLSTQDINSLFIDNATAGRLFVVKGIVRNGYAGSRKLIRLQGKLYTKGKVLAKTEYAYAGLVMTDQDLATKPFADIKKGLVSVSGKEAAITAAPGKRVPFMVVFTELPADLDEFEIELVSSAKAP